MGKRISLDDGGSLVFAERSEGWYHMVNGSGDPKPLMNNTGIQVRRNTRRLRRSSLKPRFSGFSRRLVVLWDYPTRTTANNLHMKEVPVQAVRTMKSPFILL